MFIDKLLADNNNNYYNLCMYYNVRTLLLVGRNYYSSFM